MRKHFRGVLKLAAQVLFYCSIGITSVWSQQANLADQFRKLTPEHVWELVDSVPLRFNAHHTQGMIKVGEDFFMTSVEVKRWPRRYAEKQGKLDRDTGEGQGHLMRFNKKGELLRDVLLGEGSVYHPGGMDFDGKFFWVPVCEYRPFGASNIYRVSLSELVPEKVFSFNDALGALAFDSASRTLIGANWGSRGLYKWKVGENDLVSDVAAQLIINPSFYIDYQHCYSVGGGLMLCSGLRNYVGKNSKEPYGLGGIDLVKVEDLRPVHQLPVVLWSASGRVMTTNPSWLESTENGIRAYFVPDDDEKAVLYIYEVKIEP